MLRSMQRLQLPRSLAPMMSRKPLQPLIVILGSTGTGKSDLAVNLAKHFDGEIINCDAMQMYRGLPITTNKITDEEKQGVPHHLLDIIGLEEETWTVHAFKREANNVIQEIRRQGKLPIVVGGTHYYTDSLLSDENLVNPLGGADGLDSIGQNSNRESVVQYPILAGPTEAIWEKLKEVDPTMAERWHLKERRKISRSLEIYLSTGRKASDIYREQQDRRRLAQNNLDTRGPWETLVFLVYADRDALVKRLDNRIYKMLDRGLMDENTQLYDHLHAEEAAGRALDRTRGIWQSIGFKQFEPYLDGQKSSQDESILEKLRLEGIEKMQAATRRYAKSQTSWIKFKTLPIVDEAGAMDHVFVLDSTNLENWEGDVCAPARSITEKFLKPEPLPAPKSLSTTAESVLSSLTGVKAKTIDSFVRHECEICRKSFVLEEQWRKHLRGRTHRRVSKRKDRREKGGQLSDEEQSGLSADGALQEPRSPDIDGVSKTTETPV